MNIQDFPFVLNDEFGYRVNMSTSTEMMFIYAPVKIDKVERKQTAKDMLMEVFRMAQKKKKEMKEKTAKDEAIAKKVDSVKA